MGLVGAFLTGLLLPVESTAQPAEAYPSSLPPPIVLTVEGTNVWIRKASSNVWTSAYPQQILAAKDRGRTGPDSRTSVRLSDLSVLRIGTHSEFEIQPLPDPETEAEFSLWRGLMRLLNRDRPGRHRFVTPTATAATRGTEFVLNVDEETGRTTLTVFEGEAELSNSLGSIQIATGEQGIAVAGSPPTKTAVIDATATVQWSLYYPAVLDPDELALSPAEVLALADSLDAYRNGDLLRALGSYPPGRSPASDQERIYRAALLLAVGEVEQSALFLDAITETDPDTREQRLAGALRTLIAAVTLQETSMRRDPDLSTEFMAASYYAQSTATGDESLATALTLAEKAAAQSPDFGFAYARVAELEFSFGRRAEAKEALRWARSLTPRNAQALALEGFLLASENRSRQAIASFERAMAADPALGNAWLGRGLSRIRRGQVKEGRFDLQMAAALEPQRSALRSYLGKAFSLVRDGSNAEKELRIAKELDPNDPTPWLYAALLRRDQNRINKAIAEMDRSLALNDNRRVYRSRLLLDQDRAVRSANQASIYRDAGLLDTSLNEAGRAVTHDYANHSAHLFLADSYNELRDRDQVDLRFETAWFTEYLLGNLLAPVGAGSLAQNVSQQEYSKLFERNGPGLTSLTEYLSHGEWYHDTTAHATHGNTAAAVEVTYHTDDGQRPNNDLEQLALDLTVQEQITPQDSVFFRVHSYDAEAGDILPYYSQAQANPGVRVEERHEPWLLAGVHHEWTPQNRTLLLAGWLQGEFKEQNPFLTTPLFIRDFSGSVGLAAPIRYESDYATELQLYSVEAQQIWQQDTHALVLGALVQSGEFKTANRLTNGSSFLGPVSFGVDTNITTDMLRLSAYAYDQWQVHPDLTLVGGISYDRVTAPDNFRYAPVAPGETTTDQVSPKAGFIWTPARLTTVRAAYTRGLGGVSLDQSVRLEPSQVAGFNQAFRSLIPESVTGPNAVPTFETGSVSLEQRFGRGTYLTILGELHASDVDRTIGVVDFEVSGVLGPGFSAGSTRQELDYREKTLMIGLNQLLGDRWALGARYRISQAELDDVFPDIPTSAATTNGFLRGRQLEAVLQQAHFSTIYNHPSGFLATATAIWTAQTNRGYTPDLPGDDFWQFNLEAGYRFAQRRAEVRLGLLNLTDQDYQLNPLNLARELPRERTLAVTVRVDF